MKCRMCGEDVSSDAYFCGVCGAPVNPEQPLKNEKGARDNTKETVPQKPQGIPPVTCRNCGGIINSGDKFCRGCGKSVDNNVP